MLSSKTNNYIFTAFNFQGRSPVDPLIIDARGLLSESTEKEGDLPSVCTKKGRKINTILPAVPTRSAFIVTLYSPGYTIEREMGKFTRGKVATSAHKVLIYIEHHSVCPFVGIGTPSPL